MLALFLLMELWFNSFQDPRIISFLLPRSVQAKPLHQCPAATAVDPATLNNKFGIFSLCLCQESLNEALAGFAEMEVTELKLFQCLGQWERAQRALLPLSCSCFLLPCSGLALFTHTQKFTIPAFVLFWFGGGEREQTIWASKVSLEGRENFSCSPIEVCRKDLKQQMIFFPFFLSCFLFSCCK